MPHKVIIIDDLEFIKNNMAGITRIAKGGVPILPLSDPVFLFLKSHGLECLNYHDFEEKDMYSDVYSTAKRWGMEWYKSKGKDITQIDNFSLGNIIEWSSIYFFSYLLKIHLLLSQVVKKISPEEVILIVPRGYGSLATDERVDILWKHADLLPALLHNSIVKLGSPVKLVIIKMPYMSVKKELATYIRSAIKAVFIYLNKTVSFLHSLPYIFSLRKNKKKILFFEGFQHFFPLMKSKRFERFRLIHLHKTMGLSLLPKLYHSDISVESLKMHAAHGSADNTSFDLNQVRAALSDVFVYRGEDILSLIWPRIAVLFKELFPKVVYPDLMSAKKLMKRVTPACLVVENDSTYHERMMVVVAKSLKIKSFVIQHGSTWIGKSYKDEEVSRHDFYPVHCDACFAFGEVTKDWLLNLGAEPGQVIVSGCARFDKYYRDRKPTLSDPNRRKSVLVLLNDSWSVEIFSKSSLGLNIFYYHISQFIELAKRNPEIDFIVRPRHKNNYWDKVFTKEKSSLKNFFISNNQSLEESFSYVDVVAGYMSTALFEAVIAEIPVISLNIGGIVDHFPLWEFGLSRQVNTFHDLEAQLQRILFDKKERESFVKQIRKNAHLVNYNHDGRAVERITTEINKALL